MLSRCPCGTRYTLHDWLALEYVVRVPDFAGDELELRNCRHCHSSLSVSLTTLRDHELELGELQRGAADALVWARIRADVDAERRALVWIALLDRAQGYDHRRWDHLRLLYNVRDYRRRMRSMAAWRAQAPKQGAVWSFWPAVHP